ncbi:MAG: ChbG/HpnK family deacetylase [Verrucomicrobia bacterium]|nr:ChbG/HpnK family deacetylase [Verrucomicrobiota bacterium]
MKHLIITADDFGRSPTINAAIERAYRSGALTQASLMVNEPAAAEAVAMARRCPGLQVGLHLTLCAGLASQVSPLTDLHGNLPASPTRAGLRYAFSPRLIPALQAEIAGQFDRFLAFGLPPTYWDGHLHLHLHPTIFRLGLPIALQRGFRAIRLVREPAPRSLISGIFHLLSRAAQPALLAQGVEFSDRIFGLRQTERMTQAVLQQLIAKLPEGLSEIYFHPGAEPEEFDYSSLAALLGPLGVVLTRLPRQIEG